jgi:hypothetical protein
MVITHCVRIVCDDDARSAAFQALVKNVKPADGEFLKLSVGYPDRIKGSLGKGAIFTATKGENKANRGK